ncbi:MAG: restriction endonuclease subunit S [Elusimicrobiota bacterium]|jgi:type I restriction enzyme S subunit|nr:restriction endonuclease subunit S [Elusimicrobiota bacterium]
MNEIEKMIKKLCPRGVEFRELGQILNYQQPAQYIVKNARYSDTFNTPVLTAGQTFILGYTNETDGIFKASKENPVIIFDDFTTSFHWVDFNFKVKSSAMKMLRLKSSENINFRFVYYAMHCIDFKPRTHTRQWISNYSFFKIPIPPLEIQKEIAGMLDTFIEFQNKLIAEAEERRKQYEYYREKLLTFRNPRVANDKNLCPNGVEFKYIGEVCEVRTGGEVDENCIKGQVKPTTQYPYPVYSNGIETYGHSNTYKIDKDAVTISSIGNVGYVAYRKAFFTPIIRLKTLVPKTDLLSVKFLYYVTSVIKFMGTSSILPSMNADDVKKYIIPVPSLAIQKKIVDILDTFIGFQDKLIAEAAERRKQYEYYREKLLTFKQANIK